MSRIISVGRRLKTHRPFKSDAMESADHMLEWLMETSNVAFYCDLSAKNRRAICEELVRWRRKAVRDHVLAMDAIRRMNAEAARKARLVESAPCCFSGVGRACPIHEGGKS